MSSSHVPSRRPKWLKNLFKRKPNEVHKAEATSLEGPQPSTPVENLKIGGRFASLLLPRMSECVDVNPAKMAFKILNVILEVRKEINDNRDELQAVLQETLLLLSTVLVRMEAGPNPRSMVTQTVEQYKREVDKQLERVKALNDFLHPSSFKQIDYEYYKTRLTNISREIGGATNRFNTAMSGITGITVEELRDNKWDTKLRQDLQPSKMADYRFIHDHGKSALNLRTCTKGTRVNILNDIMQWANDSSVGSASVFWLSGQAGAGKTTIAYTIADWFGRGKSTTLGASFFCSRQFVETRSLQRIVPTISFQLAQKCRPYRDSLHGIDTSDVAHFLNIRDQLETILFQPWNIQKRQGRLPTYLVIVDALDEIEEMKRSSFLEQLLRLLETDKINGLKFLVTSRPDPDIVKLCKAFLPGAVCKLQDVPIEDAKLDIKTYLSVKLENLKRFPEFDQLNDQSAGLFIYAATAVKILKGRELASSEQLKRLRSLLSSTSSHLGSLDQLYQQIMRDAFGDFNDDPELLAARLSILYTFLCSAKRISASVAATLLDTDMHVARLVLDNLHAVMYVEDDKVYWYHASFPDFIFNHARSNFRLDDQHFEFSCNAAAQHSFLSSACFRIMGSKEIGLRFNIGDIKSSYLLDREHAEELRKNVDKNILPVLRYACMHWSHHLCLLLNADDRLCRVIWYFLQIRVLFWIEAMNLIGSSGDCFHLLQNVAHWLSKNNRPGLAKDFQEAAYFAAYFSGSPAADSTPHLYISSLATWQSASRLIKGWRDKFSGLPLYYHTEGIGSLPLMTKRIKEWPRALAFSDDGKQVVAGCWASVVVLDTATGRQQHTFKAEDIRWIKFSQDGTRLVVASLWNKHYECVCIRDASSFHLLQELYTLPAAVSTEETHLFTCPSTLSDGFYQAQVMDIVTGTFQGTVKMPESTDTYNVLQFSNMLKRLLVQHLSSYSLEVWDISSEFASKTFTLKGHSERVFSTAMSPDGTLVATGSQDATARVWETLTGNVLMVLPHEDEVVALSFSYNGTRLVSGSQDGSLHVWDTSTGAKLKVLDTNKNIGRSIAFSRDGSRIASISEALVYVWSWDESEVGTVEKKQTSGSNADIVRSNKNILRLTSSAEITISDDSKRIMSATMDHVQVWDSTTGAEIMAISSPDLRDMWSAKFSSNGERLIWSGHAFLKVLDATTGNVVLDLKYDSSITIGETIAMSRSGSKFAFMKKFYIQPAFDSQSGGKTYHSHLVIWDAGIETELVADTHTCFLSFSDDEQYIVSGSVPGEGPGCIVVWDVLTGDVTQTMESNIQLSLQSPYANNGRQVAACIRYITRNSDTTSLCEVWDISSGKHIRTIKTSYWPHSNYGEEPSTAYSLGFRSVSLSHDGKKLAAACDDGFIRIWSYVSNESVADVMLVGHSSMLDAVTFSKDDRRIVSCCWDGSAQVWDLDTDTDKEKYKWKLQDSGWIVASRQTEHRLMWVSERLEVMQPQNIITTSRRGHGVIGLKTAMIGEDWKECYSP